MINVTFSNLNGTRLRALKRIQMQKEQEQQQSTVENAKDKWGLEKVWRCEKSNVILHTGKARCSTNESKNLSNKSKMFSIFLSPMLMRFIDN